MFNVVSTDQIRLYLSAQGVQDTSFQDSLTTMVTGLIERYIDKNIIIREYTEYMNGNLQSVVSVRNYPIYSVASVYSDPTRDFLADTLISTDDYFINKPSGLIELAGIKFTTGTGSIRVIYKGGIAKFTLYDEQNNYLDIENFSGSTSIELTAGEYTGADLAAHIQSMLLADATITAGGESFTCIYDETDQKFKISSGHHFTLLWKTGANGSDNLGKNVGSVIRFNTQTDDNTGTLSALGQSPDVFRLSVEPVNGVPDDIVFAAQMLAFEIFSKSPHGKGRLGKTKETTGALMAGGSDGTTEWLKDFPNEAKVILGKYKRAYL